jgi:hypothetical protein
MANRENCGAAGHVLALSAKRCTAARARLRSAIAASGVVAANEPPADTARLDRLPSVLIRGIREPPISEQSV